MKRKSLIIGAFAIVLGIGAIAATKASLFNPATGNYYYKTSPTSACFGPVGCTINDTGAECVADAIALYRTRSGQGACQTVVTADLFVPNAQ